MRKNKGFVTISSLLILLLSIFVIVNILSIVENNMHYIENNIISTQTKYIAESHLNFLLNNIEYRNILDDFILFHINKTTTGKAPISKFNIEENIFPSSKSDVNLEYNIDSDTVNINIISYYNNIKRKVIAKLNLINEIYLYKKGYLNQWSIEEDKRINYLEHLDYINKNIDEIYTENLIVANSDIIIENDIEFTGIIISTNGKIIVDSDKSLIVNGIILTRNESIGNILDNYDFEIIKKYGQGIPGFFDYKIINKKVN